MLIVLPPNVVVVFLVVVYPWVVYGLCKIFVPKP